MSQSETAKVIIPKDFRHWFGGAREKELEVYDISELPGIGMFGTIKLDNIPVWGSWHFAARKNDQGRWYISRG